MNIKQENSISIKTAIVKEDTCLAAVTWDFQIFDLNQAKNIPQA